VPLYCEPKYFTLTADQMLNILRGYAMRHPERARERGPVALLSALKETFPCKGSGIAN
jgi:hypothetical protein